MSRTVEMRETFAKAILLECVYGRLDHNVGEEVVAFRHGLSLRCSNGFSFIEVMSWGNLAFRLSV